MPDSIEQSFVNYYEALGVTEDADTADIEEALEHYEESMTFQLNNPLTMQSARYAVNTLVPAIRQYLLSGQKTAVRSTTHRVQTPATKSEGRTGRTAR